MLADYSIALKQHLPQPKHCAACIACAASKVMNVQKRGELKIMLLALHFRIIASVGDLPSGLSGEGQPQKCQHCRDLSSLKAQVRPQHIRKGCKFFLLLNSHYRSSVHSWLHCRRIL